MEDLFEREQKVYDRATLHLQQIGETGAICDPAEFSTLAQAYGRLLKQIRRITRITDKTAIELNASKQDLEGKVHYDSLTGIYNRRFMEEKLSEIIRVFSRSEESRLSVLMMDIDYFKRYNDAYGHDEGDCCLRKVASALQENITRETDFVARYGGEEFIAVLPNTDEAGAGVVAEKILQSVRSCAIPHQGNEAAFCVTISVGGTSGRINHTQTASHYVKQADRALYTSKQSGRNRYTFIPFEEA